MTITFPALNPIAAHSGRGAPEEYGLSIIHGVDIMPFRIENLAQKKHRKEDRGILALPGGLGTYTELIAPMLLKQAGSPLMQDTPFVILNMMGVHDGLIKIFESHGLKAGKDFHVIDPPLLQKNGSLDIQATAQNAADLTMQEFKRLLDRNADVRQAR